MVELEPLRRIIRYVIELPMDMLRYLIMPATTLVGILGFLIGGPWVWLGAATFAFFTVMDALLPQDYAQRRTPNKWVAGFPLYVQPLVLTGLFVSFGYSVNAGINPMDDPWQVFGSLSSLVWLSIVPNLPIMHELLHRRHWFPRFVAQILGTFFGDPLRGISHIVTHHIHLDTPEDNDSAPRGETIYTFIFKASYGAYMDTLRTEAQMMRKLGLSPWNWRNRMYQQFLFLAILPGAMWLAAGSTAAAITVACMIVAKLGLEALNYFQHYGLVRVPGAPVGMHHTWNHLGWIARAIGCEITNHIHHHLDGHIPYYALTPEPKSPQMPSLFLCVLAGIIPPIWFKYIAMPRLKDWDLNHATPEERKLAMAANARAGWPQWA